MTFPPTITEAAAAIRAGKLTSVAIVEQCLERIRRYDEKLRAWVLVDHEGALSAAAAADRELAKGHDRGSLHGIPIGIKDIIDVEGLPTRCGSPLTSPDPAQHDATVVAHLRKAGAIILGKTTTCEWACFDPSPTRNPWNLERSPGGSSSGSAAAVAAGMCFGAIGTQTGGSIIRPAAFCGVCGFKPTMGSISTEGVTAFAPSLDHVGFIARSVADLSILYSAAADDRVDAISLANSTQPPTLAELNGYFAKEAADDVRNGVRVAIDRLAAAGANITARQLDDEAIVAALAVHRITMAVEVAGEHDDRYSKSSSQFGPQIRQLIEEGLADRRDKFRFLTDQSSAFREQITAAIATVEGFCLPAVSTTAPTLDSTGDSRFQALWSLTGIPAVTIPCALGSDRLPIGLQLVGKQLGDVEILQTAAWCEQVLGFHERPPFA